MKVLEEHNIFVWFIPCVRLINLKTSDQTVSSNG